MKENYFSKEYMQSLDAYWRASNYLSVAQLYLLDNPLMRDHQLCFDDIKKKVVGHWGTVPGQNFVYAHCNRVIKKYDLDMIFISGPGHGGNFLTSNCYLEGTFSEYQPEINFSHDGMKKFCKQFSFPGGIGSHAVPEVPGSIHEGGELGYSLAHAFGAVFDNPNLIATVVVGDGEAETGPLATAWHGNKFLNPQMDGVVLPILHLNGYKIANPTVLSRLPKQQLKNLMQGYGYYPIFVEGNQPEIMHIKMAKAMDKAIEMIKKIKASKSVNETVVYPMIVLRTPKGWTGPKIVDGKQIEGSFRAHQVPISITDQNSLTQLEQWLKSYKPDELFDENYKPFKYITDILPTGDKRMTATPYANGGKLLKELKLPKFEKYAVKFKGHGTIKTQDMLELGNYVRDVLSMNPNNYRIFSPDENNSNRLSKVLEKNKRNFNARILPTDDALAKNGHVMDSYLSEHMCEGWLEGYILTGRHGMFNSYEAFIRVVDSMIAQHAKWLKACKKIEWRKPVSSLNLVLTSNVWQQDHNGFTHQDPGLLDMITTKDKDIIRAYLPADANSLISCFDHCTKSKNYINVIVSSKHPSYQWLNMDEAKIHCEKGLSVWDWACFGDAKNPDIVFACCGATPTIESLAGAKLLHEYLPELNIRFVNVVDLMKLVSNKTHPHGLTDKEYDAIFTKNKPIIFNFHGYPQLVHTLTYNRHNQDMHVAGYHEEGTITTAFDMRVRNHIDRYHLILNALNYLTIDASTKNKIKRELNEKLKQHTEYINKYGIDMPEIENWNWNN